MVQDYLDFHNQLIEQTIEAVKKQPPFSENSLSDLDREFLNDLNTIKSDQDVGQRVITTIISRYPHITPLIPRDLFWFFGGDCLHFLGDEELKSFQNLDEIYHDHCQDDNSSLSYAKLRAKILELQTSTAQH